MSPDARVHPEPLAVSDELDASERPVRGEHVTERASASDDGQARLEGNSTAGQPDSPTLDYPDQPQARSPSLQVCLSSSAVLLSVCVYAYKSRDRVQCYHLWIPPIVPRRRVPLILHGTHQGLRCSFLPRPRVTHFLAPRPILLSQKKTATPNRQRSYRSPLHRNLHHRHLHHRVDLAAVHESSPRLTSKDDN